MAINTIFTHGFGNGTYNGTVAEVVTFGYSIGEAVVTGDTTFAVAGTITADGQGVESLIASYGLTVQGAIIDTQGVTGTIDANGQGVESLIQEYGQSVSGEIS